MKPRSATPAMLVLIAAASLACNRRAPSAGPARAGTDAVESEDVPQRKVREPGGRAPVIWIGLDGVDWELMDRLSAEGKVPNWTRLVSEGAAWRLKSFMPILSPVVWTTLATGVGPDLHRVLDFQEVDPKTGLKIPITGFSRAVPAVWNIASSRGLKVGVVGWWATHPAERVNGFFISDHASPILFPASPVPGVAFPPSLDDAVARVIARDGRVTAQDLMKFVEAPPEEIAAALSSGRGMEDRIVAMSRILSATRVTQRLSRDLYDREHPDLAAVYFEGTDEIGHVFAPVTPPRMSCVSDEDYQKYHRAAETYFRVVDALLGQWMRRAREDGATLIVNSDHGFKWGSDRTCDRSSFEWSTAAFWHRMEGVLVAWGARTRPSSQRGEASVFDLAPTVLALLGLPADPAMTGRPLVGAFRDLHPPRPEPLFGGVEVERVAAEEVTPERASEYTKKLQALGYLSGGEAEAGPVKPASGSRPGVTEGGYNNLGLFERDTRGDLARAEADFRKALELRPGYHSPMFNLAVLFRKRGEDATAIDWLFRSFAAGHAQPEDTIVHWAAEYRNLRRPAVERTLLERGHRTYPGSEVLARTLANVLFEGHDCRAAFEAVKPFAESTREFQTLNALGLFETCLGDRPAAVAFFRRSLALQPGQAGVERSLDVLEHLPGASGQN